MENTGTSPLEVINPSNKTSLETPDLSLETSNKTQQLIDLGSPSKRPSPSHSPSKRPNIFRSPSEHQRAEVKHSLTRSLSLDHKKVTRSKVTDNFEHTELTGNQGNHLQASQRKGKSFLFLLHTPETGEPRSPTTSLPLSPRQIGSPAKESPPKQVNVKVRVSFHADTYLG
ncbi:Uncharacterized protein FWK35_00026495 [Aphis craccivora]|uniref:Uncharacterized protein n=1 Tax=Aphis craccivora TaxID=307492 RepID=A0A6G0XJS2_APHCR|nr:Uncharacterized protein FWK35_00026495 [Aphis craccivora]